MSFLSGLKKVGSWISGSSFSANLAKTAIIGYTIYRLNRNLNKANSPSSNIDEGVRLQINPSAENRVPVVYGAAFLGGIITDAEMSNNNKTMHFCITISEKTGNILSTNSSSTTTFRNIYWNDQRIIFKGDGVTVDYTQDRQGIIDRSLEGRVKVYCYDGGSNNPVPVQGFFTTGLPNAAQLFTSWETATHQMNNLIFAVVRVDYDKDRGVTSLGNVKFHIENSMTRPGDCLYDYFTNSIYGAGVPGTEIDTNTLVALNTYSNQPVTYEDQTLGPNQVLAARYRINGVLDTEKAVLDNIENLASSAGSWISYDVQKGQWGVVINREDDAVASFDDSTVIGSVSINGTGIEDLYNRVKAEFPNRDIRDAADFVTIALPSNERNPNEYENTLNISYELINEPVQAEILSFIELKQSRVDLVIRFTTDYSYTTLTAGDIINFTNSRLSWTNKPFRIIAVNEKQDESGQLLTDITALEYSVGVYSVLDLFRFTRSDQNGIITIGSIGVPGTPVVTKIEQASRPRIIATSISPTGIVERMEFWRTTDVTLSESQRNYTLIGTVVPDGGGTFGIGQTVTFEYDNQGAGNFLIKTRGVNSITTGPFSEPSGIIEFQPQQVPDQIGPNTQLSGIIGALGALELLNLLDRLFKNDAGEGGLFDKIFSIFKDETGVDLVGDAKEGELVVSSELGIKSDGEEVTTTVSSIDFIGPIAATGSDEIEVKLINGKNNKDILAWNAAANEWQLISGCITCEFPAPPPPPPPPPTPCFLQIASTLPADKNSWQINDCGLLPPLVPHTGSYFISFSINPGSGSAIPLYTPLNKGVGNVYLYASDGTLEQTIPESSLIIHNNVVEIPFAPRTLGKDYYITFDDGIVVGCDCENQKLDNSTAWNFTVAPFAIQAYSVPTPQQLDEFDANYPVSSQLQIVSVSPQGVNCLNAAELKITFSEPIRPVSGIVVIKDAQTGVTISGLDVNSASVVESVADWGVIPGLQYGRRYSVTVPAGAFRTDRQEINLGPCDLNIPVTPDVEVNEERSFVFTTVNELLLIDYRLCSTPYEDDVQSQRVNIRSNIQLIFSENIKVKATGEANVRIYEAGGAIHQIIDLNGTYENKKYGEIYQISGKELRLNPTKLFKPGTSYYLTVDSGALLDNCSTPWVGISSPSLVTWTTDGISASSPPPIPPGQLPQETTVSFEFDRPVQPGSGVINIYNKDNVLVGQLSSSSSAVSYS